MPNEPSWYGGVLCSVVSGSWYVSPEHRIWVVTSLELVYALRAIVLLFGGLSAARVCSRGGVVVCADVGGRLVDGTRHTGACTGV